MDIDSGGPKVPLIRRGPKSTSRERALLGVVLGQLQPPKCPLILQAGDKISFVSYSFYRPRYASSVYAVVACPSVRLSVRAYVTSRYCIETTRHQTLSHNFTNYFPIFKFCFASGLGSKFATNSCLNIPPRFKHVATLPCEI